MDKFIIRGGKRLHGEVVISGAKNAAVAIIPAVAYGRVSRAASRTYRIFRDVKLSARILTEMGAECALDQHAIPWRSTRPRIHTNVVPNELGPQDARLLLQHRRFARPLFTRQLSRCPAAVISACAPSTSTSRASRRWAARIALNDGMIEVSAKELRGAHIYLDMVTVGATMNIILAAVKAKGLTVIENAAREPHVVDLANFLNSMGANISGAGTDVIKIRGVEHLQGVTYSIIPDQIEAGTYMAAVAAHRRRHVWSRTSRRSIWNPSRRS